MRFSPGGNIGQCCEHKEDQFGADPFVMGVYSAYRGTMMIVDFREAYRKELYTEKMAVVVG